jgi:hypothetical protein
MRITLGNNTFAKCAACQGEDFYPAFPLTADRKEVLVCGKCEHQTIFSELVGKPGATAQAAGMPWAKPALTPKPRPARTRRARRG